MWKYRCARRNLARFLDATKKTRLLLPWALCALFLVSFGAFAQSDVASISGFVRDSPGAGVPGAKVTIKNETVEFERTITTNNEGYYVVSALPPGFYTVRVEHAGFQTFEEVHKKLDPSIPSTVNVSMTVGT